MQQECSKASHPWATWWLWVHWAFCTGSLPPQIWKGSFKSGRVRPCQFSAIRLFGTFNLDVFDEKKFRGYGPYGYDVKEFIAREQAVRMRQRRKPA